MKTSLVDRVYQCPECGSYTVEMVATKSGFVAACTICYFSTGEQPDLRSAEKRYREIRNSEFKRGFKRIDTAFWQQKLDNGEI